MASRTGTAILQVRVYLSPTGLEGGFLWAVESMRGRTWQQLTPIPAIPALDGVSAGGFVQFGELILLSWLLKE